MLMAEVRERVTLKYQAVIGQREHGWNGADMGTGGIWFHLVLKRSL